MRYIRTKDGIYEIVDYEQLDSKTKGCLKQRRYFGLYDYINDDIFVKIHKKMPKPLSQYQPIKMFEIIKQADTIEELCDCFIKIKRKGNCKPYILKYDYKDLPTLKEQAIKYKDSPVYGAIYIEDKGLIYVAKMNEEGELELL